MKHPRKAAAPPIKGETRINHHSDSGLKSKQSQHRNSSHRPENGKAIDSRTKVIQEAKAAKIGLAVHATTPEKLKVLEAIREATPGNTVATQEQRLLAALEQFNLSTFEGSRYLDAYDVRARVMGLRHKGHNIVTTWALVETESGRLHRVGVYTLLPGAATPATTQPSLFGCNSEATLAEGGIA